MLAPRQLLLLLVTVCLLAGCGGTAGTPAPIGYPLNACPTVGEGAVVPKEGYHLVVPGEIVFAWGLWHNESGSNPACGAQSVKGSKLTIRRSELRGDPQVIWTATLSRAIPLVVPAEEPRLQLFRVDDAGPTLLETTHVDLREQYRAEGYILPGAPVGRYRMQILSLSGEVWAEGSFDIVE